MLHPVILCIPRALAGGDAREATEYRTTATEPGRKTGLGKYQMLEILDALEEEKCVLILGNYAFSRPDGGADDPEAEIFLPDLLTRDQHKWMGAPSPDSPVDFFTSAQALIGRPGGQRMFRDLTRIRLKDLG
jgi:hypothetical protein